MIELLNSIGAVLLLFITAAIFLKQESFDLQKVSEIVESVSNVLNFLGDLPKWLQYYTNLNANVEKLEDKKDNLENRWKDQKLRVKDEEFQTGRTRKKEVDHWLRTAKTKLAEVENLLHEINRGTNHFSEFLYRAWWGNRVEKKILEVDDLYSLGVFEEVLSTIREIVELPVTPLVGKAASENIRKITAWLQNGVTKIGVHGIRGIGKTALLKHIHNQLPRNGKVHVYMVPIPENCQDYQLQNTIADALGVNLQEEDVLRRAAILCQALQRRNFVLILDGLTKNFALENVGIRLDPDKGKLIISSRSPDVCRKMGCQKNSISVNPLSNDEGLHLFKEKMHVSSLPDRQLEIVARQIVEKCEGVAVRIIEKASDLIGIDDLSVWQKVCDDML